MFEEMKHVEVFTDDEKMIVFIRQEVCGEIAVIVLTPGQIGILVEWLAAARDELRGNTGGAATLFPEPKPLPPPRPERSR